MALQHHSSQDPLDGKQEAAMNRFLADLKGESDREWPNGRISGDDDGESAYAIAADKQQGIVRIQFPKPMVWLGLDITSAEMLIETLEQKVAELKPYVTKPYVTKQ